MKCESAEELSRIYHAVTTAVNAQESIGRPIDSHGMDLFNHLAVELFDPRTRLEWESTTCGSFDPPDHETLTNFISKRILTLNAARPKPSEKTSATDSRSAKSHHTKRGAEARCPLCQESHILMLCRAFKAKSANERKAVIESHKLCYNCFGTHQVAKCQSTKNCLTCKSRHHSMLHDAYSTPKREEACALSAVNSQPDSASILLATARVKVTDCYGDPHEIRVLIDQGSEVSIVSEALVQRLRLRRLRSAISISGIGGAAPSSTRGKVDLTLASMVSGSRISVTAFVLPRLSAYQGCAIKISTKWSHIRGLQLADPRYLSEDPVELLLGAEVCAIILEDGLRKGRPQDPIAQRTSLGWILSGGRCSSWNGSRKSLQCTADSELTQLVQRFWEQETEPVAPAILTPAEKQCEEHFIRTHSRTSAGRYVVRLPFKSTPVTLTETRKSVERLLTAMEKRALQDPGFGTMYSSFMKEYEDLKHMEEADKSSSSDDIPKCFLPHHGVIREASSSTKLRVVFNGSQRTRTGESLNSSLLVGANLLPTLADVLLRWRLHRFVFITDIEKMYRQILVHPTDRDFQRILWRHTKNEEVKEYRLNTVTYGLACAPFLAIRTLHQLANDEGARYPRGAAALRFDCYVDDIVSGSHTITDAVRTQTELRELCMAGGFSLRKWAANSKDILAGIPREHQLQERPLEWEGSSHSTLGLRWHPKQDHFHFVINKNPASELTKRRVLAETARLFDPLGWLAPVVMQAKILIQSTWLKRIDWDSPLPAVDARLWQQLFKELPSLENLRVNRWLHTGNTDARVEIHGFADASERGYAAVTYLRVSHQNNFTVHLLSAKTKVAPLKKVSLPRLELCAAALLTNLTHHVRSVLNLLSVPIILWSDSKVALHWIEGHSSRWKTFVANRVSQIQLLLPEAQWRHVPGKENPADCASRGINPSELQHHSLWWTGPAWLKTERDQWPGDVIRVPDDELPEQRLVSCQVTAVKILESELLLRFSTLNRLLRVTAWCLRWRHAASRSSASLQPEELNDALLLWIRLVQRLHFPVEMASVSDSRSMPSRSPLAKLSPFKDDKDVLRVGGRLKNAILSYDERHPIILPTTSWLTRLLIQAHHRRTLHGGIQATLGLIRLRFWIPRGRAVVKQLLHRCVVCTRWRAATPQPTMANLPRDRVTPARPFLKTGVDYAGPVPIRTSKGRGHRAQKGYIAVFVCFSTRAVHLEVVSDYSTEAFLAAFRQFTARRGLCTDIFSDCGTTFVGADRQLQTLIRSAAAHDRLTNFTSQDRIKWHFNPPAAPHFGGLWEAAVKSTKHHLRRVIGEAILTFEELSTFLAQVEACLNSRPLQALTDDPNDLSALTPGHFLIGAPLLSVPEPPLSDKKDHTLTRWQHLQKMRDHLWRRWSQEYIHQLASKPKWTKEEHSPKVGDLCLIRSELTPPSRWPLEF